MLCENYKHEIRVLVQDGALVSLGRADRQGSLLNDMEHFCDRSLPGQSVYVLLHRERDRLFPDAFFADLFSDKGRRSVPPSVVATVMVLQRLEGLSDREAVERYTFDTRWRYAAGVGSYDCGGWSSFAHTVLVDMRARLAASERPRRIFEVTTDVAKDVGLVGAKRVLDSTPLYDAVATMDTITLVRSAVRGLLKVAGKLSAELRGLLESGDDYSSNAKPQVDWDDEEAREGLVDSRAKDGFALLAHLDGKELGPELAEAAKLLATVLGQDLEGTEDGTFRIARKVAKDRVISTVDPEARHGHKTSARGFDGYKGNVAIDPDSEIITNTIVSAGNAGDASVAKELIDDLVGEAPAASPEPAPPAKTEPPAKEGPDGTESREEDEQAPKAHGTTPKTTTKRAGGASRGKQAKALVAARRAAHRAAGAARRAARRKAAPRPEEPRVYGDAAYGTGALLDYLARNGIGSSCKVQPPVAPGGRFSKQDFTVDLERDEVTCPAGNTAVVRRGRDGDGTASFGAACANCPLRDKCTESKEGRSIAVSRYEALLAEARAEQQGPAWRDDYRATRPKVERKQGHLVRRKHGGRRARARGTKKVDADFNLLAAAHNLARLAVLGVRSGPVGSWRIA